MTDDLRFPIGKFERPTAVTPADRSAYIEVLAQAPARMRAAVAGLTAAQLDTPYRPEGWTVRQVVHHVPDSHMHAYLRFRLALAEDTPTVQPYAEATWAKLPHARTGPIEYSQGLLDALHVRWVALLKDMTEADFARGYRHPEHPGRIQPLGEVLALYAWHSRHHVAHITGLRTRMGW